MYATFFLNSTPQNNQYSTITIGTVYTSHMKLLVYYNYTNVGSVDEGGRRVALLVLCAIYVTVYIACIESCGHYVKNAMSCVDQSFTILPF